MANPVMSELVEASAEALGSTTDPGTGIKHQTFGADENSAPSAFARLMNLENNLMTLVAAAAQGLVIDLDSGLNVGVFKMQYSIAAASKTYAGDASVAMTASATNYLSLDATQTLTVGTSGWPVGDHVKLATVVTDATTVTTVTDRRPENYQVGAITSWWLFNPTALVDFNNQDIDNVRNLGLADPPTVVLSASGAITLSGQPSYILVDTFNGDASDMLTGFGAFTAGDFGRIYILQAADAARTVTIQANLTGPQGAYVMDDTTKFIAFISDGANLRELFRSFSTPNLLSTDLDAAGFGIADLGLLDMEDNTVATMAAGVINITKTFTHVATEAAAATDDLDTISGVITRGTLVRLVPNVTGEVVVVKHATGNIRLANGKDYKLSDRLRTLDLRFDGSFWVETGRSDMDAADLAGTSEAIPYTRDVVIPGALTVAVTKIKLYCPIAFTIKEAYGSLGTAPAGGPCIIDIMDDGLSIFSNQSEMINILDAATFDQSVVKNHVVAAGSTLTFEIEAANGAADATVVIGGFIAAQTPPT